MAQLRYLLGDLAEEYLADKVAYVLRTGRLHPETSQLPPVSDEEFYIARKKEMTTLDQAQ
jgi:hypothetical protein